LKLSHGTFSVWGGAWEKHIITPREVFWSNSAVLFDSFFHPAFLELVILEVLEEKYSVLWLDAYLYETRFIKICSYLTAPPPHDPPSPFQNLLSLNKM